MKFRIKGIDTSIHNAVATSYKNELKVKVKEIHKKNDCLIPKIPLELDNQIKKQIKELEQQELEQKQIQYDKDLYCLTAVIYQEAGSDDCSDLLQQLVARTVLNRVLDKRFGNSIYDVLTAKHQYGMMWKNGIHIPNNASNQSIERCKKNALIILKGNKICPSNVLYQSEFKNLGDGIYKQFNTKNGTIYFNYKN